MELVITMAGNGRRMTSISRHLPKELLPLSSELIEGYYDCSLTRILSFAREAGVVSIYGAIPMHASLEFYGRTFGIRCAHVAPLGEAYAVAEVRNKFDLVDGILICSADNVFSRRDFLEFVNVASNLECGESLVAVEPKPSVSRYTEVTLDTERNSITALVEKPQHGNPGLAKSGLYYLSGSAAARCFATASSDRFDEWSMTEALKHIGALNALTRPYALRDGFTDIGTPNSYRAAVVA